jgi:cytoplasmic iron level regulating protein YaaA (DUF328/UPF0246 family)
LILTICSNHKNEDEGGRLVEYQTAGTFREYLTEEQIKTFYKKRRKVFNLIKSDEANRDEKEVRKFPYNKDLKEGHDFLINCDITKGKYLPAASRYDGRFYITLSPDSSDRLSMLTNTPHNVVIISGLYGLLTPTEQIQCYSCNVSDHQDIAKNWTDSDIISDLLTAYIKKNNITKVFDLIAVDAYRRLISWEIVRNAVKGNMLHCFSKQFSGGDLLFSFGRLTKELLDETENNLLDIKPGDSRKISNDEIYFLPSHNVQKKDDMAREIVRQEKVLELNDKVGRMRRNYIKIIRIILKDKTETSFGKNIMKIEMSLGNRLKWVPKKMEKFNGIRRKVEYENYVITPDEWAQLRQGYSEVIDWETKTFRIVKRDVLEDVD